MSNKHADVKKVNEVKTLENLVERAENSLEFGSIEELKAYEKLSNADKDRYKLFNLIMQELTVYSELFAVLGNTFAFSIASNANIPMEVVTQFSSPTMVRDFNADIPLEEQKEITRVIQGMADFTVESLDDFLEKQNSYIQ